MVMAGGAVADGVQGARRARRKDRRASAASRRRAGNCARRRGASARAASISLAEIARTWYLQAARICRTTSTWAALEVTDRLQAEPRHRHVQLRHACGDRRGRSRDSAIVEILDYVVVEDGGKLVNPMVVDGQILGGVAQGIGTGALRGDAVRRARPAARFDLRRLSAAGIDRCAGFRGSSTWRRSSPYTEFGVKGIGEGGAIAPPAAIANAINDALRPLGAIVSDAPITPRRILAAIEAAEATR